MVLSCSSCCLVVVLLLEFVLVVVVVVVEDCAPLLPEGGSPLPAAAAHDVEPFCCPCCYKINRT